MPQQKSDGKKVRPHGENAARAGIRSMAKEKARVRTRAPPENTYYIGHKMPIVYPQQ
jgi:hypothetical protein